MSMFTLDHFQFALIHGPNVPGSYAIFPLTALDLVSIISHIHNPVTSTTGYCFCFGSVSSFFLELSLHWSPVAYWAPTTLGPLSFSVHFLPFPTVHGVPKARILKWFAIPFSRGPRFLRPLHHDPAVLGGPTEHDSEFHWLRQAVVHVIILVSFLWLWFSF